MKNHPVRLICAVCEHPRLESINEYLARGGLIQPGEVIFKPLKSAELRQHRDNHLRGVAVRVQTDPVRVGQILQDLTDKARSAVDAEECEDDIKLRMLCIAQALKCVQTEAEITGVSKRFSPHDLLPQWQRLQGALLIALEPFPEAKKAVLAQIEATQHDTEDMH